MTEEPRPVSSVDEPRSDQAIRADLAKYREADRLRAHGGSLPYWQMLPLVNDVEPLLAALAAERAKVEQLTERVENLALISNVNGDWNVKILQYERERDADRARADRAEAERDELKAENDMLRQSDQRAYDQGKEVGRLIKGVRFDAVVAERDAALAKLAELRENVIHMEGNDGNCLACEQPWMCESYIAGMAEYRAPTDMDAAVATLASVEALFSGGPDTSCRTVWQDGIECVSVPLADVRAALGGSGQETTG